jgi:hypothetical protein
MYAGVSAVVRFASSGTHRPISVACITVTTRYIIRRKKNSRSHRPISVAEPIHTGKAALSACAAEYRISLPPLISSLKFTEMLSYSRSIIGRRCAQRAAPPVPTHSPHSG